MAASSSTATGERADGTAINASYTAKYDGTEVKVTGSTQRMTRLRLSR